MACANAVCSFQNAIVVEYLQGISSASGRILSLMVFKIHPLEIVLYMHIKKQVHGNAEVGGINWVELFMLLSLYTDIWWQGT